jgi:hypothetical protein
MILEMKITAIHRLADQPMAVEDPHIQYQFGVVDESHLQYQSMVAENPHIQYQSGVAELGYLVF